MRKLLERSRSVKDGKTICGIFYFFILVFSVEKTSGQVLKGFVKDAQTGNPLAFARVQLVNAQNVGTLTNMDGYFQLPLPPQQDIFIVQITYMSYEPYQDTFYKKNLPTDPLVIALQPKGYQLQEIVITQKDNFADIVMKNVLKNREKHQMSRLERYKVRVYNKMVVTVDNVQEHHLKNPLLKPAKSFFEHYKDDTLVYDERWGAFKFTVFLSETITDFYYVKPFRKEIVLAKQNSGTEDEHVNILSASLTQIDIYQNSIVILGRPFIGPVNPLATLNYYFYLEGFERLPEDTIYKIRLYPRSPHDMVFDGYLYVSKRDWAIVKAELNMNKDPNINFVEGFRIYQEFKKIDGNWLLTLSDIYIDFKNNEKHMGVIGRVTSHYQDYQLAFSIPPGFFSESLVIEPNAGRRGQEFWENARPIPLERSEEMGFVLADSLKAQPLWQFYLTVGEFLTTGKYAFSPKWEVGPYSQILSYNAVEGWRFSIGVNTTSAFHPHLYLMGKASYGTRDQRLKTQFQFHYYFPKQPYHVFKFIWNREIEQIGIQDYLETSTDLMGSLFRYRPLSEMNYFQQIRFEWQSDVIPNLMQATFIQYKSYEPVFPFSFQTEMQPVKETRNYETWELGLQLRFSYKEDFLINEGRKVSLGSYWPTFHLEGTVGRVYPYQNVPIYYKAAFTVTDHYPVGRFGVMEYTATIGKIGGTLPLPSLYIFPGSQSYGYYSMAFAGSIISSVVTRTPNSFYYIQVPYNLMAFYEFIADQYLTIGVDHHLEGYLLNRLPLIRKLKWKEMVSFRLAYGTLSRENQRHNLSTALFYQAPYPIPYMELGIGLENVLKVLQIVYVRRLSYLNHHLGSVTPPNEGIRFGFRLSF
jgi:hypothetical protein